MPSPSLSVQTPDIPAFRVAVEDWARRLNAAVFAFYSGQAATLDLHPIFADHAEWFAPERCHAWAAGWAAAAEGEAHTLRRGMQWTVRGALDAATEATTTRIAQEESRLTVEWDGGHPTVFEAQTLLASEQDPARRRALHERLADALHTLEPEREKRLRTRHGAARDLGFASYLELHEYVLGVDLRGFAARMQRVLTETEDAYLAALEPFLLSHARTRLGQAHAADAGFLRAFAPQPGAFPEDRLRPALDRTLHNFGLAPLAELPIVLDLERRPTKRPRAFCCPIDIPHDIRVSHAPRGGPEDFHVTFHEMGHALHFAHMGDGLPPEDRYVGDLGLMETYAFFAESFVTHPHWLRSVLGVADTAGIVAHARLRKLFLVRRYIAKLQHELRLHALGPGVSLDDARAAYARDLTAATRLATDGRAAVRDVDDGFYVADYLRAWCLDAQIRRRLADQFGPGWLEAPAVGALLRSWWEAGNGWSADDLAAAAGVGVIRPDALIAELRGGD